MSNYETPEQRRIRELSARISYLESKTRQGNEKNSQLLAQLEKERRNLEEANRKIREQASKQRELDSKIASQNADIKALDRQIQEKERLQRERMEQMRIKHEQEMEGMRAGFAKETANLKESIAQTKEELRASIEFTRKETDRKLKEQEAALRNEIQENARAAEAKIKEVDDKIEGVIADMKAKEKSEQTLAQYWVEQSHRLLQEMIEEHRGEIFAPDAIRELQRTLSLAEGDIKDERFTSAADGGRSAFYRAMDLKEEIYQAELEWNMWFNALKEKELQLLEQLRSAENRSYQGELDGETITDDAGIDYWTRGQLTVLQNRVAQFREGLAGIESMPTEKVKEQMETLVSLAEELTLLEHTSHTNFTMAISRYQMADKIGEILGDNYHMIDCDGDYYSGENNQSYHAVFEDPITGNQAAVVVTPVYGEDGVVSNHIELIIGNADNNPITRERMSRQVAEALNAEGVLEGGFPCSGRHEGKEKEEIARVGNIAAVAEGKESAKPTVTPQPV